MFTRILIGLAVLALITTTTAGGFGRDILPPGYKGVKHEVRFTNLESFPGLAFQLELPAAWDREPIQLAEGMAVSWYKLLAVRLAARPASATPEDPAPVVARSPTEIGLDTTAPKSSAVASRLTTYRVVAITDGQIELLDMGTELRDANGRLLGDGEEGKPGFSFFLVGLPVVVLLAIGVVVIARSRRV